MREARSARVYDFLVGEQRWYKSLYWRIALGFVIFLAAMLVVQAVMFTWAVRYSAARCRASRQCGLAQTVALDLANALTQNPQVDLTKYVHDQYSQSTHPFFVMMTDGRYVTSGSQSFPDALVRMARARLRAAVARTAARRRAPPFRRERPPDGRPPGDRAPDG